MSEWRTLVLDDIIKLQRGYDLPTPKRNPGSIPVIGAGGISGRHDMPMVKGPGVVLGRAGASMGKATFSVQDFWPLNTALFVTDFCGNDPRFVYYLLTRIDFSGYNSGAAQPMLNRNYIKQISTRVPQLEEQRAISGLLGALDDKVAVNDRIDAVVDDLLEALYGEYLKKAVSSRSVQLKDVIDLKYGRALKAVDRRPGDVPVFGGNGISGWHDTALVRAPGIVIGRKGANAGSVSWADRDFWPIDTSFYVELRLKGYSHEFLFFALRSTGLPALVGDSAIPGLNRDIALAVTISLPGIDEIQGFTAKARALFEAKLRRRDENKSLEMIRDTLLPKLMSGEIRVREAEKVVEGAV